MLVVACTPFTHTNTNTHACIHAHAHRVGMSLTPLLWKRICMEHLNMTNLSTLYTHEDIAEPMIVGTLYVHMTDQILVFR